MSLARLLNVHEGIVARYTPNALDDRGNQVGTYADQAPIPCRMQFQAGTEFRDGQDTGFVDWLCFVSDQAVVDRLDRWKWQGKTFEVRAVGPQFGRHALHHQVLYLEEVDV